MPRKQEPILDLDHLGAGDSYLVQNLLSPDLENDIFGKLKEEVAWNTMLHRGGEVPRLVAVQGEILENGSFPIYRHPSDQSPPLLPFSPTVSLIRQEIEMVLKHPVNHVLIQLYRSGGDFISEHSDKTIDVVRGSNIVNVSVGAQRVMTLKTKKDALRSSPDSTDTRQVQRIPLPHNSMFVMGLETNKVWLHGINHDNRPFNTKSEAEQRENGQRISLTFRQIGTFLTADQSKIYGQGAKQKTFEKANPVVNGSEEESAALIMSFSKENHSSDFNWDEYYGAGSDVLHFTSSF